MSRGRTAGKSWKGRDLGQKQRMREGGGRSLTAGSRAEVCRNLASSFKYQERSKYLSAQGRRKVSSLSSVPSTPAAPPLGVPEGPGAGLGTAAPGGRERTLLPLPPLRALGPPRCECMRVFPISPPRGPRPAKGFFCSSAKQAFLTCSGEGPGLQAQPRQPAPHLSSR